MRPSLFPGREFSGGSLAGSSNIAPLLVIVGLLLASCSGHQPDAAPVEPARELPASTAPVEHWPLAPGILEEAFATDEIEILSERYAGRGTTGASRVELRISDPDATFSAKWKPVPLLLDGINNAPRKEIAAYAVQKLVLDPEDYVVPTTIASCLPREAFPSPRRHSKGTLPGTRCELGVFAVWLDNVTLPDELLDVDRFERDPIYARHLANFNLVTYLIRHQDGRRGNFLVSTNDADRRVFAIDNGVAFSGIWYNWFVPNWKRIRVPALPHEGIERLRPIREGDLEFLGVLAELRSDAEGMLGTSTPGANLDPDDGARWQDGVVQFGLTDDEIEDLYERIEELLEDVDEGDLRVLPPLHGSRG